MVDTDCGAATKSADSEVKRHALVDKRYLKARALPSVAEPTASITYADLFSGLGALSLGVAEAARAIGARAELQLAADFDLAPLKVLRSTFGVDEDVAKLVDLSTVLSARSIPETKAETELLGADRPELDVLVAGPPCQGHSRLNNHTRHDDPRNDLYGRVVRFAELRKPRLIIIENVDSVVNDGRRSAAKAIKRLEKLDYTVDTGSIRLYELGVPQKRRRHVLVATRAGEKQIVVKEVMKDYAVANPSTRDLRWAIGDLENASAERTFDSPSIPSKKNRKRMKWLHEREERVNLPNSRRPKCHRDKKLDEDGNETEHSYVSMYGKLSWGEPAQTITSGYGSMGQGRYVHPSKERTLTPHEAARLQFIPDFVAFDQVTGRGFWARMIGNVAPMKLSYVFALEFLR